MEALIALWNMPKDWSPAGGLIWITGLAVSVGVLIILITIQDGRR
jgi:hypothetical protein